MKSETPKFQIQKRKTPTLNQKESQEGSLERVNNEAENLEIPRDARLGSPQSFGNSKKEKIKFQKFNWDKVESRVNCWGPRLTAPKRQSQKRTPERRSQSPNQGQHPATGKPPRDFHSSDKKFYDIDIDEEVKVGKFLSPYKKSLQMLKQAKNSQSSME